MNQDHKSVANNHLKNNASSDTEEQVRERRRLAEREVERKQQEQGSREAAPIQRNP
jgi:hypothetical protein